MNQLMRFEDLREWLMSQIDGSEETRGDDGLISDFIRQIDALPLEMGTIPDAERKKVMDAQLASMPSVNPAEEYAHRNPLGGVARVFESMALRIRAGEPYADVLEDYGYQQIHGLGGVQSGATTTVEPKGCPTPGSCSAVAELADLKQRLLPQFAGRAQRAEHERDAMLEQLIEARSAIQQSYGCLWRYTGSSNPMFLQARKMLLARLTKEQQASGIRYANEVFGHTTEHEILHSGCSHDAALSATGGNNDGLRNDGRSCNVGRKVEGQQMNNELLARLRDLAHYDRATIEAAINALSAPFATAATDLDEFVRVARTFSDEHYQNALVAELRRAYHALFALQDAPPVEVAEPDRPDWARQLPGAEIFDRSNDAGEKP